MGDTLAMLPVGKEGPIPPEGTGLEEWRLGEGRAERISRLQNGLNYLIACVYVYIYIHIYVYE